MENDFENDNKMISARLSDVFSAETDNSLKIIKPVKFIYKPEILDQYVKFSSLFFQSLTINNELFVDDKESYIKNLFEDHLDHFILVLKRMIKTESENDYDFILKFTEGYYGKHLPQDYILERLVFKFNDDNLLSKYSFLKPYLKKSDSPIVDYDPDIFKNKEGFLIFKDFAQYHISNEIMDFGFIFQSLKKDKFILNVPHLQFVEWLFKNNFINQKINDEIDIRKGFASIKKLSSEARQNSYLKLKEKYLE